MAAPVRSTTSVPAWPTCPQCGAKRVTRCVFCRTTGIEFPPADVDFGRLLNLPGNAAAGSCCGPGGCSPVKEIAQSEELHSLGEPSESPASAAAPLLLCPTCDEPFTPQFARRCNDCGHEFPDGFDDSQAEQELRLGFFWWLLVKKLIGFEETPAEPVGEGLNPRILFCLGGIILFIAAVVIYLWRLF